jgi:3',5'-nucleoside bisphosphate phosphatase
MKLDLHLHSNVSDGRFSPAELVHAAAVGGLDVIALADHDTADGVFAAKSAALGSPLYVIPAIEVSTRHGAQDLHILGYWINPNSPLLLEHQAIARRRREERMRRMVAKLQAMHVAIEYEDVLRVAGPAARVLGRPHLARALLEAGHIRHFGEAFDRYLHDGGPAFVLENFPSVAEAIELIHAADGLAVWAHPPRDTFEREIRAFAALGLDGVECLRPGSPPAESLYLEAGAEALGLLVTGGSDWHGLHSGALGEFFLRPHELRRFLDAAQSMPLLDFRRRMPALSRQAPPPGPP